MSAPLIFLPQNSHLNLNIIVFDSRHLSHSPLQFLPLSCGVNGMLFHDPTSRITRIFLILATLWDLFYQLMKGSRPIPTQRVFFLVVVNTRRRWGGRLSPIGRVAVGDGASHRSNVWSRERCHSMEKQNGRKRLIPAGSGWGHFKRGAGSTNKNHLSMLMWCFFIFMKLVWNYHHVLLWFVFTFTVFSYIWLSFTA